MEELIMINKVGQSFNVHIPQVSSFNNSTNGEIGGGLFTVSSPVIIKSLGVSTALIGERDFSVGVSMTSGSATLSNFSISDVNFLNTYGASLVGLEVDGLSAANGNPPTGNIPQNTTITNVAKGGGPIITMSANATATSTTDIIRIQGRNDAPIQLWEYSPNPTLLATVVVSTTTAYAPISPAVTLQPGVTYALTYIGAHNQVNLATNSDVSIYNTDTFNFTRGFEGNNFIGGLGSSPPAGVGIAATGTQTASSFSITLTTTVPGINIGDWVGHANVIGGTVVTGTTLSGGLTIVKVNNFPVTAYTSQPVYFWTPTEYAQNYLTASMVTGFNLSKTIFTGLPINRWDGDFYMDGTIILQEPIKIPPPPLISSSATGQFTITLPTAILPTDLLEYDLQYAKALDNATFGNWLDIGTFPAVQTQDATDTSTSNVVGVYVHTAPDSAAPLPFYIYRYRLRTSNYSESEWSYYAYAGQVQAV